MGLILGGAWLAQRYLGWPTRLSTVPFPEPPFHSLTPKISTPLVPQQGHWRNTSRDVFSKLSLSPPLAETKKITLSAATAESSAEDPLLSLGQGDRQDRRFVWPAPGESQWETLVRVSSGMMFRTAVGHVPGDTGQKFEVRILSSAPEQVFEVAVFPPHAGDVPAKTPPHFVPFDLDLSPWAGQTVTLQLKTFVLERAASLDSPAVGGWASPRLVTPANKEPLPSLILVVFESLNDAEIEPPSPQMKRTPSLTVFSLECTRWSRVYTTHLNPASALSHLVGREAVSQDSKTPKMVQDLPALWRSRGGRTVLWGSTHLSTPPWNSLLEDFEETHRFPSGGLAVRELFAGAAQDLARRGDEPFLLVLYVGDPRGHRTVSWSAWRKSLGWGQGLTLRPYQARRRAWLSEVDRAFGLFRDTLETLDDRGRWRVSLHALAGSRLAIASLKENSLRVPWMLLDVKRPAGQDLPDLATLDDVPPTLLRLVAMAPANLPASAGFWPRLTQWEGFQRTAAAAVDSPWGQALVTDGRYKYIRWIKRPQRHKKAAREGTEELYDLWRDPGETQNRLFEERTLLARCRDEMQRRLPWPMRTDLVGWGLSDKPLKGRIYCSAGDIRLLESSQVQVTTSPWSLEFTMIPPQASLAFATWPPDVPYECQLKLGDRPFPRERIRVSKLGLPLFEEKQVSWQDRGQFLWMEGLATPRPEDEGPLLFLGRRVDDPREAIP